MLLGGGAPITLEESTTPRSNMPAAKEVDEASVMCKARARPHETQEIEQRLQSSSNESYV